MQVYLRSNDDFLISNVVLFVLKLMFWSFLSNSFSQELNTGRFVVTVVMFQCNQIICLSNDTEILNIASSTIRVLLVPLPACC